MKVLLLLLCLNEGVVSATMFVGRSCFCRYVCRKIFFLLLCLNEGLVSAAMFVGRSCFCCYA